MRNAPPKSMFPRPHDNGTKRRSKLGTKAPTRDNITPVEDLRLRPMALQARATLHPEQSADWPRGNLDMEPNAFSRSSMFGCSRRKIMVGMGYPERILAAQGAYVIKYTGPDLDQNDSEVWQLALAWCRASGKPAGSTIEFNFNDWCRVLERSESSGPVNDGIMQSLKRLASVTLTWDSPNVEGICHLINDAGRDKTTGKGFVTLSRHVAGMLKDDGTELHLRRKVRLKSSLAKWMHDYYSTSSTPHAHNLSTLRDLSGTSPDVELRMFRVRVLKAVEDLKQCDPPLFAPETRVERKQNGEYALFVVKATNSRILPLKRTEPVVASLPAPAAVAPQAAHAVVAMPIAPPKQPVRSRKAPTLTPDDYVPVWDRDRDPSDTRTSEERKRAYLRERDLADAAIYAVAGA
ncbi:TrfA protein [Paraburkholderia phenazinium]|uniref:TrfA protein n=1 Tax=Paraburkholderia phenazinium TaxID=60549 RepID=A0A1G7YD75_9BURK|nr:plasmid replication initiator TrfA [Paraburkholderia phenazinium]SDG93870.1 TrfA protein [Paraburkholderia phenazinium]